MKINYELENKSFYPGDSLKINFRIKNTYDYTIDFNHRQFPVKVCVVLIGKNKKEMNVLDVSLSKAVTILTGGQVMESSLTTVIPRSSIWTIQSWNLPE